MIAKIKTNEGKECFAIVLSATDYEEIVALQESIICILQASTQSNLLDGFKEQTYDLLELLAATLPTDQQAMACERVLFPKMV